MFMVLYSSTDLLGANPNFKDKSTTYIADLRCQSKAKITSDDELNADGVCTLKVVANKDIKQRELLYAKIMEKVWLKTFKILLYRFSDSQQETTYDEILGGGGGVTI